MTNIPNTPNEPIYPTRWVPVDILATEGKIECRQTSDDTFELRSATHEMLINREGFNYFRGGDNKRWHKWLEDNKVVAKPRTDNAES